MDVNSSNLTETATILPGSAKSYRSNLNLFKLPNTDVSVLRSGEFQPFFPANSVRDTYSYVEFNIETESNSYIDFAESYLELTARIVLQDGTIMDTTDICAPCPLFFHAMFSNCEIWINQTLVSDSSNMYPYIGYLQRLLTTSPIDKKHFLQEEFYFPNTGNPEEYDKEKDSGFKQRYQMAQNSKAFTMLGQLVGNITTQTRYLVGGTTMKIVLRRSQPEFCIDCKETTIEPYSGVPYKFEILEAKYMACKRPISQAVLDLHRMTQQHEPYKYPSSEIVCKSISLPSGISSFNSDTIINGKIPKMLILGLVGSTGFHGTLNKSPFNFKDYDLTEVTFSLNSETLDTRTIPLSFSQNSSGVDNFWQALRNLRKCAANESLGNGIDADNFRKGMTLFYNLF